MKTFFCLVLFTIFIASLGYCQDMQDLINQATQVYGGDTNPINDLIAGFSVWGFIGGIIFSSIGFIMFVYGKKNTEFKPIIVGVLLMSYPFFVKSTLPLYLIGIALIASLYIFRD